MTKPASLALLTACLSLICCATAEPDGWQGKRAAISLTYDDSLNVHLDTVAPALDSHGFHGTFYINGGFETVPKRLDEWRALADEGHELGNHTLFHPCEGGRSGREWVQPALDLTQWTPVRFHDNLVVNNTLLTAMDGRTERTFAYPCGDTKAGGEDYVKSITPLFTAARAVGGEALPLGKIDLMRIPSHMVYNDSAEKMTALVDDAIERGAWLVFLFHGVGGEHDLNVDAKAHAALLDYLKAHQSELWVDSMQNIASYVRDAQ